jgi:non-canonical (house-cleaning) NTP pyrophosphatase
MIIYHKLMKIMVTIYVASTSSCKVNAVKDAFEKKYECPCEVIGVPIPSNVSEQPTDKETYNGCCNRMNGLQKHVMENKLKYDYLIAMESGIVLYDDDEGIDMVVISCEWKSGQNKTIYHPCTKFPKCYYDEAIKLGVTVGSLMKRDFNYDSNDWHENYGDKISRRDIISSAILKIIKN